MILLQMPFDLHPISYEWHQYAWYVYISHPRSNQYLSDTTPPVFPVGSDTDQLLPTPPGSPSAAHWRWQTKLFWSFQLQYLQRAQLKTALTISSLNINDQLSKSRSALTPLGSDLVSTRWRTISLAVPGSTAERCMVRAHLGIQTFFLNFCLCQYLVRVRRKIVSVTWQKKTTLFVSVPEETPGYHPTPESSPELTKRSWFVIPFTAHVIILVLTSCRCLCHIFKRLACTLTLYLCPVRFGSLMSTEKDESYTVVVKGKALASIKVSEQLFFALHLILDLLEGWPDPRLPLCGRPAALRALAGLVQARVQEGLHRPSHVPATGDREIEKTGINCFPPRCGCRSTSPRWQARTRRQLNVCTRSPSLSSPATSGGSAGSASTYKAWSGTDL